MKTKQRKQRERESETVLRVPNTREGKRFLKDLRAFKVAGVRVWCRGRGPRAKHAREVFEATRKAEYLNRSRAHYEWLKANGHGDRAADFAERLEYDGARMFDQDLPLAYAREFAVYIWKPAIRERVALERRYEASPESAAWKTVQQLQRDRVELIRQRDEALRVADLARDPRAEAEIGRLTADRAELIEQRDRVQTTNNRLREKLAEVTRERDVWKNEAHRPTRLLH